MLMTVSLLMHLLVALECIKLRLNDEKLLTIIATSLMVTAVNANPLTEFPKMHKTLSILLHAQHI